MNFIKIGNHEIATKYAGGWSNNREAVQVVVGQLNGKE